MAILLVDQVTKAAIVHWIPEGSVTFDGRETTFFFITHERNTGLVGGAFNDRPLVAYIAPLFAAGVLVYLFRHLHQDSRTQAIAYGMVAGGAIGNLIDRFFRGSVVDFLQVNFYFVPFDFPWKRYPAFNIADSGICTGVVLLMISWYWLEHKRHVSRSV